MFYQTMVVNQGCFVYAHPDGSSSFVVQEVNKYEFLDELKLGHQQIYMRTLALKFANQFRCFCL